MRSISGVFTDLQNGFADRDVSIGDLLLALHERGFGFVLLIFAAPMALPIPVPPGINIILATPLILLTAQQAIGRHTIWLPESMKRKTLSRDTFNKFCGTCIAWLQKLEIISKPRLGFITQGLCSNLIGVLGFVMALTVCIPLPLTNTVPSLGIALMAVGVIMRDGLAVLVGAIVGSLWIAMLTAAVILFGTEGIDIIKDAIKSVL